MQESAPTHTSKNQRITAPANEIDISSDHLPDIFTHGFTTKKDGVGFGVNSAALAIGEMGENLRVSSDGLGKGAA